MLLCPFSRVKRSANHFKLRRFHTMGSESVIEFLSSVSEAPQLLSQENRPARHRQTLLKWRVCCSRSQNWGQGLLRRRG
ncbi:hypothetical protein FF1_000648 [Malus domestica]